MTDTLATTRRSLHGVAELVMAGHSHRTAGRIRLAVRPDGFVTVDLPSDPVRLRVSGTDVVAEHADGTEVRAPLRGTFGGLADAVGVACAAPQGLYDDTTGLGATDLVEVDADAARTIYAWFAAGDAALRTFATAHAEAGTEPILWPEHFDVAIAVDEVNYGVSAGDATIPTPYAYVGPWSPREGTFWNASFGATRGIDEVGADADALLAFFESGRAAAHG